MSFKEQANFTHGLIVVDLNNVDENGETPIIHFTGYYEKPTELDVEELREELVEDKSFGLSDKMEDLTISEAPEEIIQIYRDQYMEWLIRQN